MPIQTIINLIIKIFLMLALGFALRKRNVITPELNQGLSDLLLKAILPINILSSANTTFTAGAPKKMLLTAGITFTYYLLTLILMKIISKKLPLSDKGKSVFVTMVVFANTGFVGIPLISELYGADGMIYAVIYNLFYQLFFFSYGISLLDEKGKFSIRSVYTNKVTLISLISIAIFLSPFRFPEAISSTFTSIGSMTVPISMMIIGYNLAGIQLSEILKDAYSYLVSAFRLLIIPFIMLIILKIAGVDKYIASVCILMTAVPSGSLNAIYSEKHNCEPDYAIRTVVQTMLFMIVTLPVIIILINQIIS